MNDYHILIDKVVSEYLEKYPDAPSNMLARMLKKDHSELFNTKESARTLVRHRRGATGEARFRRLKNKKYAKYRTV